MSISFTVLSLCPFKQDNILKHFLKGLSTASHAHILQNKYQLVDRACVCVCWLSKSLAVRALWKGVGRKKRMDTEYNDSLCLTENTEGSLHNTIINL